MCHDLLRDARLYATLLRFDEDLAAEARAAGCACGGMLHSARYPRKARGGPPDLGAEYDRRLSFCCAAEGCRRRCTPPSVLFLERRVYLGVVVVLVSAMRHGVTPPRVSRLRELVGVSRRTLQRWRAWWTEAFPATALWRAARARFVPPPEVWRFPASLLECFSGPDEPSRLLALLAFLSPLSSNAMGA